MRLADMVRWYIWNFRLDQTEVAKEIGWSSYQLTRFVNGLNHPKDIEKLNALFEWCVRTAEATMVPVRNVPVPCKCGCGVSVKVVVNPPEKKPPVQARTQAR